MHDGSPDPDQQAKTRHQAQLEQVDKHYRIKSLCHFYRHFQLLVINMPGDKLSIVSSSPNNTEAQQCLHTQVVLPFSSLPLSLCPSLSCLSSSAIQRPTGICTASEKPPVADMLPCSQTRSAPREHCCSREKRQPEASQRVRLSR